MADSVPERFDKGHISLKLSDWNACLVYARDAVWDIKHEGYNVDFGFDVCEGERILVLSLIDTMDGVYKAYPVLPSNYTKERMIEAIDRVIAEMNNDIN